MRCCKASTARILTLFTLVVLLSHSFGSVNAQSSTSGDGLSPSLPVQPTVTSTPSDTQAPSSTSSPPSVPPSSASPTSSTPPASASSASSSAPSSQSPVSSSAPSSTQPSTQSSSSSAASSSGSSSSASSSSVSSSSSSSSASFTSSSSSADSLKPGTLAATQPIVTVTGSTFTSYAPVSGQFTVPTPSASSDAPAATGADQASSPKSFLQNKGAMAGVFGVAGVIGAMILIFVIMKVMQRRARKREQDEEEYFEKYNEPPVGGMHGSNSNNDSSWNLASETAMAPARADAYPDRAVHYGSTQATRDYNAPQQHEYPPGTAYAAAASGNQYQYQYTGYGTTANYGSTTNYDTTATYDTSPSSTGAHPFADPQNVSRGRAPPVAQVQRPQTQVADAYDGIDDGYAQ